MAARKQGCGKDRRRNAKNWGGGVHLGKTRGTEPSRGYTEDRAMPWGQSPT